MHAKSKMELLAPAGGPDSLRAAIDAGADAVYFGLKELNARRGAENFTQENLIDNLNYVHSRNARAYLTLNIDISQREIGEAYRHLELARQCKVDAVLIKDPSLLKVLPLYPELEFHFSTQAGISSSAGVRAAKELGIKRVVLAREMSLDEIKAASSVEGLETEVFVQGALCFSVSGHCLLSSWIGGRSGNRGLCASPCRFEWKIGDSGAGRFLSMHDLSLLERLDDLQKAGVRALKIEGRLKSSEWISRAVGIYRKALDTGVDDELRKAVGILGEYTGRKFTDAYAGGVRKGMTGDSGRIAVQESATVSAGKLGRDSMSPDDGFSMELKNEDGKLACTFTFCDISKKHLYPMSVVRSADRAVTLKQIGEYFSGELFQGAHLAEFKADEPEITLQKGILRKIENDLSFFLRTAVKKEDGKLKLKLPPQIQEILDSARNDLKSGPNRKQFNGTIDIARVQRISQVCEIRKRNPNCRIIIDAWPGFYENNSMGIFPALTEGGLSSPLFLKDKRGLENPRSVKDETQQDIKLEDGKTTIALPPVFFENDIGSIKELLKLCSEKGLIVEVNSWDGWFLARQAGVDLLAGPGLSVLNSVAADFLHCHGCQSLTISMEADGRQIAELAPRSPVPLILYVLGRPPLLISRVEFPDDFYGKVFEERRNCRIKLEREWGLSVFRAETPFDLRKEVKGNIAVADFAAELPASSSSLPPLSENPATFNYLGRLR